MYGSLQFIIVVDAIFILITLSIILYCVYIIIIICLIGMIVPLKQNVSDDQVTDVLWRSSSSVNGILHALLQRFVGQVHVIVARPVAVICPVDHVRRDGGQQRRSVGAHAQVTQQHFRYDVRPRRPGVLADHRKFAARIGRTLARPFQVVLQK